MPEFSNRRSGSNLGKSFNLKLHEIFIRKRHVNDNIYGGENVAVRTTHITFTAISLVCTILLAAMFGSRAHALCDIKKLHKMSFARILVYLLYIWGTAFVVIAAILESGLDPRCKVIMQLFLVERAHAARFMIKNRRKDWIWIAGVIVIVLGFGSIAVVAFRYPYALLAESNGKCIIGVPLTVTIPVLTYEIVINVALTGLFIGLLRQILRMRDPVHTTVGVSHTHRQSTWYLVKIAKNIFRTALQSEKETAQQPSYTPDIVAFDPNMKALKKLIYRSVLGAGLILLATIANIGLLYKWRGHEDGWLCFTMYTVDVTWSSGIVHFLTIDRKEEGGFAAGRRSCGENSDNNRRRETV